MIQIIQDCLTAVRNHIETEQQRINDPCWQVQSTGIAQETVYIIGQLIVDMLNEGTIKESDIPMYAFDSRVVWRNVCDEE